MSEVIRGTWESEQDKVKNTVLEKIAGLDKLQEYIRTEPDLQTRELLLMKSKEEQDKLNVAVSNLEGMENMLAVAIGFLNSIKDQMNKIENKLIEIGEDVAEIKKDVKYLCGKTIGEIYMQNYKYIMNHPRYKKVFIVPKAKYYSERLIGDN